MMSVIAAAVASFNFSTLPKPKPPAAKAIQTRTYGELEININVPSGEPIFTIQNWLPGDCISKTFTATNKTSQTKSLAIKGFADNDEDQISKVVNFLINSDIDNYFNNKLAEFFRLSDSENGVSLGTIAPSQNQKYTLTACFDSEAGNDYQNSELVFDLIWGETFSNNIDLPPECSHLKSKISKKIEGDNRNNRLQGTHESELILGYDGNDRIDAGSGDDCIVGGKGNDRIEGQSGNDIVLGGDGNDRIDAGSGNDRVWGGAGYDRIEGRSGEDFCEGERLNSCEL